MRASVLQFGEPYTAEGAGLVLSVPRILNAAQQITPLMSWFDPGDRVSPFIFDLFPCNGFFCKKPYAGIARVHVSRLKVSDGNIDGSSEDNLRRRVSALLVAAEADRQKVSADYKRTYPRLIAESLRIDRLGGGLWAHVEQHDPDGYLSGSVYWRILDGDYTISASYAVDRSLLPKGVSVDAVEAAFLDFVKQIKIVGVPRSRN